MQGRRLSGRAPCAAVAAGLAVLVGLVPLAGLAASPSTAQAPSGGLPHPVPDAAAGFATTPIPAAIAPTAIAFGPGDADGPDLYATTLTGTVQRLHLDWTPAGPALTDQTVVHEGLDSPFGLAFVDDVLYVTDTHEGQVEGRDDGVVWRIEDNERRAVVDGLPTGRHQADHVRQGPDGRLYVGLGPADTPPNQTITNVEPYSGSILAFDPDEVSRDPAVLHWFDADGDRIPEDRMATHPRNADFNDAVEVVATGLETAFGLAFAPDGALYTPMMGGDDPTTQDVLYRIAPGTDYGFPECHNVGPSGATGDEVRVEPSPAFPDADCSDVPAGTALLGWHVGSTGIAIPQAGGHGFPSAFGSNAVYVAEVGPLATQALVPGPLEQDTTANDTGHKVARVVLDEDGQALAIDDFLTGLPLPTDVRFGPDGAMYVADVGAQTVFRVAPAAP